MKNILDLEMERNDIQAKTIREYLQELLLTVWEEEESFSGKRPWGNSGWKSEIYKTLAKHKFIEGEIDESGHVGYIDYNEYDKADQLIAQAIKSM